MKRNVPLRAKKPLERRSELNRGSQLKPTGRLRPRSKKTAAKYRIRAVLVAELLEQRPACERCRLAPSTDVHEPRMRSRGADICDPAQCVCLCRPCHDWVHEHPTVATSEGWMVPSWTR